MYSGTNGFVPRYIKASSNSFQGFSFHLVWCLAQSLSENCAAGSYFYSLPHSVSVTNEAFSVRAQRTKGDTKTLGVWELQRGSQNSRRKREGKDPDAWGGWEWKHYSQISICVSLCDRALERQSHDLCVFISVCVCRGREGGTMGEGKDEENERAA